MKVSIITSAYNAASTIEDTITSVLSQSYNNIEYIIIDGASTDNTAKIVTKYNNKITKFVSEKDDGIYFGLNKGLSLATGDIIGFLHADDTFADNDTIKNVVDNFKKTNSDIVYGNLLYVYTKNTDKIIRNWQSSKVKKHKFQLGWMPPHPTIFTKKTVYDEHGIFDTEYKIAADYELILRLIYKNNLNISYLNNTITKMRVGGASNRSLAAIIKKTSEDYRIMRKHGFMFPAFTILCKYLIKIPQFFTKETK